MTQVLFDRLKSNLAQCINDGTIYFVTDSNGNFTQIALGDGSKSHVVGIGPKMDDTTKQDFMSKLGLTISSNMGTIQLGKLANYNGVSSQKVVTYERTGLGTDTHEISTVGYVQQYMKTAKAMVYAGLFNAQTKEITDYNTTIISPSEEGNVTLDYLLEGYEGETFLTPGMSFIVGTAGDLKGYTGISIHGDETNVEVGDIIIITNITKKESEEGGSMYNQASILIVQKTNFKIADGAITTAKLADESVTTSKLSTDIQSLISNLSKTATFAGIATPTTNPGTPDGLVFYIANGKGTYTNFGGIDITEDEVVILYYDTVWHKNATGIASNDKLTELGQEIIKDKTFSLTGSSYYKYAQFNFVAGKKYRFTNLSSKAIENLRLSINGDTTVVDEILIGYLPSGQNIVVESPINAKGFRISEPEEKVLRIVECLDVYSIVDKSIGFNKLSDDVIENIDNKIENIDNKIAEKATDGEGIYTNKVVSAIVTDSYGVVKANFKKGRTYKIVKTSGSGLNVYLSADGSEEPSQRVQDLGYFPTANPATNIFTAEVDGKGLTGYWQGETVTFEITEIFGTEDLNIKSVTSDKIGDGEVKNVNIEKRTITEDKLAIYPADYVVAEKNRLLAELTMRLQTSVSVFAFNTDQHISTKPNLTPQQEGYPKYIFNGLLSLKEITKKIPLDAIVLGGDIAGYRSDYDFEVEHILDECLTLLEKVDGSSCNIVAISGNHDDTQNNSNVTKEEMFNVLSKRNAYSSSIKLVSDSSCSCFIDDYVHKIRYIFVGNYNDSFENVIQFLTDKLSTLPTDYNAIIFSHRPLSGTKFDDLTYTVEGTTREYFFDTIDASSVIDAYASKIIVCINGHGHTDAFGVSNGVLYIATTCACDSREPSMFIDPSDESQGRIPYSYEAGTYSDTAFDFFVIDQEAKTIEALRYGQGCNRKWYYKGDNTGLITNTPIIRT